LQLGGKVRHRPAALTQRNHPLRRAAWNSAWRAMRPRAAIAQAGSFGATPQHHPFANALAVRFTALCHRTDRFAGHNRFNHAESTCCCRWGILVGVHSVLLARLTASQPQLLPVGSRGQRPETSHLGHRIGQPALRLRSISACDSLRDRQRIEEPYRIAVDAAAQQDQAELFGRGWSRDDGLAAALDVPQLAFSARAAKKSLITLTPRGVAASLRVRRFALLIIRSPVTCRLSAPAAKNPRGASGRGPYRLPATAWRRSPTGAAGSGSRRRVPSRARCRRS